MDNHRRIQVYTRGNKGDDVRVGHLIWLQLEIGCDDIGKQRREGILEDLLARSSNT